MRKRLSCLLGALLLLLTVLTGCKGETPRPRYVITGEYFPDEGKLVCEMTASYPNRTQTALESLSMQLWANAYREGAIYPPVSDLYAPSAYYAGKSYGGIEISSVTGVKEYAVGGEDENILSLVLEEPLFPGECAEIGISFTVTLARIDHRLGVGESTVNLTHFYPVFCARGESGFLEYPYAPYGESFVNDCSDFDCTLTVPETLTAVSNGVSKREGEVLTLTAEGVRDIAVVLGEDLKCLKDEGQVPVEYWYTADPAPERTLKAAKDALSYYSRTFGAYAYPRYTLVETDFPYGGMEYSGLAMISSSLTAENVPAVVAHETAHQWWYGSVGSDQFAHAWQDEGLAEFSSALFLEAYPEYGGSYRELVKRSESGYRAYFSVSAQLLKETNTAMDRPLTSYAGDYEYRNIAYDKGVILFDRVRAVLGDRKFFAGLKEYASGCAGKIAAPEELIACFHRAGGRAEELFASFTEGRCVI